jgi:Zn-dependent protease
MRLAEVLGDAGQVGGRLRGRQDKGSLAGALVKVGFVVKAGKLALALGSFAAYALLFTWQFAVIIAGVLVIHECGHLRCMKHYGMKTRGIYLIPLLGAAAVAEDNFPSRRAEATIALAGPLTGTGLVYFATRNGAFAAAAAWMALFNLFNLLPVVPLDGGRVVKSITCSVGSRTGLAAVIAGMLLGAVLAFTADLVIFVIVIPLGLADYLHDRHQTNPAGRRDRRQTGRHARTKTRADIPAAKPPLSPRASQAAFVGYAGLAVLLWLFMLAMSHQPGVAAAMHALQG